MDFEHLALRLIMLWLICWRYGLFKGDLRGKEGVDVYYVILRVMRTCIWCGNVNGA